MAGDADLLDAMLLEKSAFEDLERAVEFALGFRDVAGDAEHARHARFADEPREEVVEHGRTLCPPGDDVWDRIHVLFPQPRREGDRVFARYTRHVRDVHRRALRYEVLISVDTRGFANRRLNRVAGY